MPRRYPANLLRRLLTRHAIALALAAAPALLAAAEPRTAFKFAFGTAAASDGWFGVRGADVYSEARGYGFEPGATVRDVAGQGGESARRYGVTSSDPVFKFSVAVPEGNYRVTLTLGDPTAASVTTVRAETRRLVLERVRTAAGQFETRSFLVNVRHASLSPGNAIKFDVREIDPQTHRAVTATWDDKLTLQFGDEHPAVSAVEIEKIDQAITVFLCGDSTVTDQATEPYGTWGQCLPRWFKPPVAIANHAESGQTLKAFRFQRRWDKVMAEMKTGDYVFLQFGHNDLNARGHDAMWPRDDQAGEWVNTHAEANTDYKWLLASYAVEVKRRGGIPVIVSPMTKINLRTGELNAAGLGDYPKAALEAAQLAGCTAIDLNAMSVAVVQALGPALAPKAYVDGLHTNTYGGYILSRCVVAGIRQAKLDLANYLVDDVGEFDPAHPTPLPADFTLPIEPRVPVPAPPGMPARGPASNRPNPPSATK